MLILFGRNEWVGVDVVNVVYVLSVLFLGLNGLNGKRLKIIMVDEKIVCCGLIIEVYLLVILYCC